MDSNAKRKFAELVKNLRGTLTQKEFAHILGVTYGAIQAWENEEVNSPSSANLSKIANYAGLSLEDLMSTINGDSDQKIDNSVNPLYVMGQLKTMSIQDLTQLYRAVSDRLVAIAESAGR
ncbi:helix-turn-helix domain-containing protein [Pseudanabaena sp. UWO311]|uniref:helix-turn-helix domain-containing protein n=1 Tax=Pseudanabaena sp. UWO311 TaxID=2487337 RepID=UPI00168161C2|nr:helix-turn-helix transcriptional regulator [Pseudanabaena sp. UWO311]